MSPPSLMPRLLRMNSSLVILFLMPGASFRLSLGSLLRLEARLRSHRAWIVQVCLQHDEGEGEDVGASFRAPTS